MPPETPSSKTRWRCSRCGNLTRFDVVRRTRVREFVHVDLAGEPSVEEREVLADEVEQVRCRWCDSLDSVQLVERPGVPGDLSADDAADTSRA